MAQKRSTRELGLILATRLTKTEDLHFGYWTPDLQVTLANLPQAQTQYSDFLIGHIPADVKRILDVGCGTGHLAKILGERGYQMECVSPSPALTELARKRLGPDVPIHECMFEELKTSSQFDLVLFSESFQYMSPQASLPMALSVLKPGGHVLISDFFSTGAPGQSALRGGHHLGRFNEYLSTLPFEVVSDTDITPQTAPNLKVVDDVLQDYVVPIWEVAAMYLHDHRPWLTKFARLFVGKAADKFHFKYISGQRNADSFAVHKSYRTLLLKAREPA